eukprot:CAMPEP_0185724338 /NCGR_PEP_ID=MMETSP1171-20130828/842_1 /TAXON_ID=374046 /ORGANISM="Helicotheca tamensis, Strain CCMP826" /LENGTH=374 /DNA_ID=CAMNT_0028392161 /DNA_START=285 /DNA_END=1409 /DNA_ORIENTATION=+
MSFLTCWFVLFFGVPFKYDPIGIISGLLWVPAGTFGIYGVRNAGIAICVGTWSGVTVLVSFIWGLFIFGEQVRSRIQTLLAVLLLLLGLGGMAYFSSSHRQKKHQQGTTPPLVHNDLTERLLSDDKIEHDGIKEQGLDNSNDDDDDDDMERGDSLLTASSSSSNGEDELTSFDSLIGSSGAIEMEAKPDTEQDEEERRRKEVISVCGLKVSRFSLGLAGAVYNGALGGSAIVPMHYSEIHGLPFVISFAIGASIVTATIWLLRFLYHLQRLGNFQSAWNALPSFHLRVMCIPGAIAGTLWSIGNVASILAVTYLGEGIGMSVVQSAMMVSGLWGILYFKEIRGMYNIFWWFVAACITLVSIIFLSHEHEAIKNP